MSQNNKNARKCPNCGRILTESEKIVCNSCGYDLAEASVFQTGASFLGSFLSFIAFIAFIAATWILRPYYVPYCLDHLFVWFIANIILVGPLVARLLAFRKRGFDTGRFFMSFLIGYDLTIIYFTVKRNTTLLALITSLTTLQNIRDIIRNPLLSVIFPILLYNMFIEGLSDKAEKGRKTKQRREYPWSGAFRIFNHEPWHAEQYGYTLGYIAFYARSFNIYVSDSNISLYAKDGLYAALNRADGWEYGLKKRFLKLPWKKIDDDGCEIDFRYASKIHKIAEEVKAGYQEAYEWNKKCTFSQASHAPLYLENFSDTMLIIRSESDSRSQLYY